MGDWISQNGDSHELPERLSELRQAATWSSDSSHPDEVELGVPVTGCGGPEAAINSTFDEQEFFNFSRAIVGSPCFRNGCTVPGRDVVWGTQIEGAARRIEEHVGRPSTTLPIIVKVMERFALDQTPAVESCEHVVKLAIR